jgi:hypothetical protein
VCVPSVGYDMQRPGCDRLKLKGDVMTIFSIGLGWGGTSLKGVGTPIPFGSSVFVRIGTEERFCATGTLDQSFAFDSALSDVSTFR